MFESANIRRTALAALTATSVFVAGCDAGNRDGEDTAATASAAPDRAQAAADSASQTSASVAAERPVDAETLPYGEVDEELVYGHFAFPSDMVEPLPAIIVVHDWWGLNDDTRQAASRLAAQGYMVLAIDLYGGETVDTIQAARARMIAVVENPEQAQSNLSQALEFVGGVAGAPKKAMLGWGLGGSWALNAAMIFPQQVDAAVVFYGQVSDDEDALRSIDAPVLGFFGAKDRGIRIDSVRAFEAAMRRLRKPLTIEVYQDAGHAFADPARSNYKPDLAEAAWQKTIEFLQQSLAVTEGS